ncbi:hypothetical protein FIE12Z_10698 [Fusarium flagelliforme]|uniref:Apple domain-containing protein n=2 Tax=Fusarium flagelliforme TaxID=2675880 RepID=A0A395MB83_9HYPO|nr:hypothetical protein FIE12Z_10698 [Fusarium flagelliforme]
MVQLNILAGSLALFAIGVNAGPCHPSVTTVVTSASPSTTEASTAAAATSAAPETCTVESPQYGSAGGEFEVVCDTVTFNTSPIGTFVLNIPFSECLDHCDATSDCQGVNYVTAPLPYCTIWRSGGSSGESKGVITARRVISPQR